MRIVEKGLLTVRYESCPTNISYPKEATKSEIQQSTDQGHFPQNSDSQIRRRSSSITSITGLLPSVVARIRWKRGFRHPRGRRFHRFAGTASIGCRSAGPGHSTRKSPTTVYRSRACSSSRASCACGRWPPSCSTWRCTSSSSAPSCCCTPPGSATCA